MNGEVARLLGDKQPSLLANGVICHRDNSSADTTGMRVDRLYSWIHRLFIGFDYLQLYLTADDDEVAALRQVELRTTIK